MLPSWGASVDRVGWGVTDGLAELLQLCRDVPQQSTPLLIRAIFIWDFDMQFGSRLFLFTDKQY